MDKQAFTNAVLDAEHMLYRVAKSILREDADCADAVQEAILQGYRKRDTLREAAYFQTWMCRILIRECYKILRKSKQYVALEEALEPVSHLGNAPETDIYACIQALDKKLRPVVVMHYVEGFSTEEIARALGVPRGTVKSRLSRARAQLKHAVLDEEVLCHE